MSSRPARHRIPSPLEPGESLRAMPRGLMVLMAVVCAALSISSGAAAGAEGGADRDDRSTASEREQARTRFERLGRLEALQLARREFPAKLDRPVWKGPRGLDDAKRYLGDATAVVDPPGDARPTLCLLYTSPSPRD